MMRRMVQLSVIALMFVVGSAAARANSIDGYLCDITLNSSSITSYGSYGHLNYNLYSSPACTGTFLGGGFVCTTGATVGTGASCAAGFTLSEPALLALYNSIMISMNSSYNRSVTVTYAGSAPGQAPTGFQFH